MYKTQEMLEKNENKTCMTFYSAVRLQTRLLQLSHRELAVSADGLELLNVETYRVVSLCFVSSPTYSLKICVSQKMYFLWKFQAEIFVCVPKAMLWAHSLTTVLTL